MLNSDKKNNLESGLNHWLYQKVTAVLLRPITIWVLLKLPKFIQLSFSDKLYWINSSLNLYLVALFFIISAFHFKLGLTVIIEDYIHTENLQKNIVSLSKLFHIVSFFFTIIFTITFKYKKNYCFLSLFIKSSS